jgi:uncharacterized protein YndB with AHSA1/START domain
MKIAHSVNISLPPTKIFAYVTNLDHLVEWSGAVITVKKISAGEMAAGTTLRLTLRFMGRWMETIYEVVEFELDHRITLKSIAAVAPCAFYFVFEPVEGGETRVSQEAVVYLSLKSSFMDLGTSVLENAVRRNLENDLLTLKDVTESAYL